MHELEICQGPECRDRGGPELLQAMRAIPTGDSLQVHSGHCRGLCHEAPVASLEDHALVAEATPETIFKRLSATTR